MTAAAGMPGHDFPKVIEAEDAATVLQDAVTDWMHVTAARLGTDDIEEVRREVLADLLTGDILDRAAYHFDGERAADDCCPAGVEVRGDID